MACWKAGADPEGLLWYAGRQGRIQWVYHSMLEGRGGSRGLTLVCWKAGADPEGSPWHAGRQMVHNSMLEERHTTRQFKNTEIQLALAHIVPFQDQIS